MIIYINYDCRSKANNVQGMKSILTIDTVDSLELKVWIHKNDMTFSAMQKSQESFGG